MQRAGRKFMRPEMLNHFLSSVPLVRRASGHTSDSPPPLLAAGLGAVAVVTSGSISSDLAAAPGGHS